MSIYGNAVRKPITTLMIFIGVMVFGIYSLIKLPVDLYPEIEYPAITVLTTYGGANASDIETNVTKPIEEVLNSIDNLKEISSVSRDNSSVVSLEFEYETDLSEAANDIRESMAFIEDYLPEDADKPTVFKFNTSMMPILFFSITADESYEGIYKLLEERLMNPLNRVEGIASIYLTGTPNREVEIQVDPHKLEAHNLTLEQIGSILQTENLNSPVGNIKMGKLKYPVRVEGEFKESYQIEDIVLGNFNGQTLYLKDVATVKDSIAEMTIDERVNGKRSVSMMVMKQSGANTVNIARKVNKEIETLKKNLPPDIEILTVFDSSEFITDSISNLTETLMYAFFFVVFVVLFFLGRWRATFIITLTIPIALIVSFIYLYGTGNSINIISLSSLAIAIGMVVDDAIVVLENISKHIDRGSSPREAAIYATNEVWLAVIITTLTVVAVFFPMTMIGGLTGVLFRQLGWIVTITVVTSTIAAITLTPMLSSKLLRLKKKKPSLTRRAYDNSIRPALDGLDNLYGRTLQWTLKHKLIVTILAFGIFLASIMLMGQVGAEFIPQSDEGRLSMSVELVPGSRLEETTKIARQIDGIIASNFPEVEVNSASAGSDESAAIAAIFLSTGSNIINYSLSLTPAGERDRSVWDIAEGLRNELKEIPEIKTFNVTLDDGGMMGGTNVDVEIYGYDLEKTTLLANEISEKIKTIQGARDVTVSREDAKPELKVELDREKIAKAGLNTAMVSAALRNRIDGMTATRFREFGEEYDVIIRYKEDYRNSISDIENIAIMNPRGEKIRIGELGNVVEYWAPPNIERKSRERFVTVSAKPYKTSLGELAGEIQKVINETDIPREIMVEVGGAYEDQQEGFMDLSLLLLLSLILVFIVMASQFESFKMPFIIMFSIPFAFTGVMLALYITNTTLSVIAGLGAIMLIGIVVKNAVVLVDYINLMRDRGYDIETAIIESGKARLRPVLMTALTTILGMLPLAIGIGEGSEIWSPMGISVIGGLIFSTIITMVIVPVIYRAFAKSGERDAKEKLRKNFVFMDIK
jgi:HAE1 family hydrophobic/amphiphilic exporter-1